MTSTKKRIAIAIGCAAICWAMFQRGESAPPAGTRAWEYKTVRNSGPVQDATLNSLGQEGWELVAISADRGDHVAVLKRPK